MRWLIYTEKHRSAEMVAHTEIVFYKDTVMIIDLFSSHEIPVVLIFMFICTSPVLRELQLSPHIKRHAPVIQFRRLCGLFYQLLFICSDSCLSHVESTGNAHRREQ